MQRNTFTQDAGELSGRAMRREAARRPLQASAPLIPPGPVIHCGSVDATNDNPYPTARSVCQAFGYSSAAIVVEPMREARIHLGATAVAIAAGVIVACILIAERYAS